MALKDKIQERMSLIPQDYSSIMEELKSLIPKLTPNWSDFSEGDIGFVLLSLMVALKDMQNYNIDRKVLEGYLSTVTERPNLISITSGLGYRLRSYKSSKVEVRAEYVLDTVPESIVIPEFTRFVTKDKLTFATVEEQVLDGTSNIVLYQGEPRETNLKFSDIDIKDNTLIISNEAVSIGAYDRSSVSKITIDGVEFREVESLLDEEDNFYCYVLDVDRDGNTYAKFSPQIRFMDFVGNSTVKVKFLVSKGADGSIGAGVDLGIGYSKVVGGVDLLSDWKFTTVSSSIGGQNPETVEEARVNVVKYLRTMDKAVTIEDYINIIEQLPFILRVQVLDHYLAEDIVDSNFKVFIYALNKNGENLSEDEKTYMLDYINKRRMAGISLEIKDTVFTNVDVSVEVYTKADNMYKSGLSIRVENAIREFFDLSNWKYGSSLSYSRLMSVIQGLDQNIESVKLRINDLYDDVEVNLDSIISLGDITVSVI